jgi:glyoxylase-like metal-dependent hydrolase (beta-lactamase superfamily II)
MSIEGMQLRQVARDVYACLQEDRGLGYSNSGLVNRAGGLVVDTFWDLPHTREMIRLYSEVWDGPARRVVNSHANGDHCWGNQLFADAEIIAHRLCAEKFGTENSAVLRLMQSRTGAPPADATPAARWMADQIAGWDFTDVDPTPPNHVIDDRLDLDLDGIPVSVVYVGPAHTEGDVIVHLPEQGVLFAGDVLFRNCTPIGWAGTRERWVAALDLMVDLAPEVIVPGHGPLCGVEGAVEMKAYLDYVHAEAAVGFAKGWSVIETAKAIDLGPYAGWNEPHRLVFNVGRAYRELRGEPWDAPLDTTELFAGSYELAQQYADGEAGAPGAS